jgi:hypothetical protein
VVVALQGGAVQVHCRLLLQQHLLFEVYQPLDSCLWQVHGNLL